MRRAYARRIGFRLEAFARQLGCGPAEHFRSGLAVQDDKRAILAIASPVNPSGQELSADRVTAGNQHIEV
jgi:hypothetical protein